MVARCQKSTMRKQNSSFKHTSNWSSNEQVISIACSHLGSNCRRMAQVAHLLQNLLRYDRFKDTKLLVGEGTAIAPWAIRAADLWQLPIELICSAPRLGRNRSTKNTDNLSTLLPTSLRAHPKQAQRTSVTLPSGSNIDQFVINRVPCLYLPYVRRKGRIEGIVAKRLERDDSFEVYVASPKSAAHLVSLGAQPWPTHRIPDPLEADLNLRSTVTSPKQKRKKELNWLIPESLLKGDWLFHCTRGNQERWPDETEAHFYDSILIDPPSACRREAIDVLHRIVTQQRMIAQASASKHAYPVVCFSANQLNQLLRRRCYRPHLHRWDYEPYGIAITKKAAVQRGIRPVIYCPAGAGDTFPKRDQYRLHPSGKTYNWQEEQEWRSPRCVSLDTFPIDEICIFAEDSAVSRQRLSRCRFHVHFLKRQAN